MPRLTRPGAAADAQAQVAVGAMGFPVLTEVLREDREDTELLQGALEVLIHACGCPPAAAPSEEAPNARQNEVWLRGPGAHRAQHTCMWRQLHLAVCRQ